PLPTGARARMGATRLRSLAISPDGKTVAAADEYTICLWDHHSGRLLHRFLGRNAPLPTVLFSTDGALLVALENIRPQSILRRWETATGKELPPRPIAEGGSLVAFTPDGKGILSKGAQQTIHLWDAATGKSIRQFQAPTDHVGHVALSPDGKTLAATGCSSTSKLSTAVYRWDVLSGKALPALDGHQEGACCVAFVPDGKTLAVADAKNTYRWELPTGKLLGRAPRAGTRAPAAF